MKRLQSGEAEFVWGTRTYLMGIINCTPDSFSGDGIGDDVALGLEQARQMASAGADILDIGGESTRPNATPVPAQEEIERVIPLLIALSTDPRFSYIPRSIDTTKAEVAEAALQAGAQWVNDVSGLTADPEIAGVVAAHNAALVIVHHPKRFVGFDTRELTGEMVRWLSGQIDLAIRKGVALDHIIVDPGIGFGKSKEQNLIILRHLHTLSVLNLPVLLGTSRKGTLGWVLGGRPAQQRMEATAATVALGIGAGVDIVRVHDVPSMAMVAKVSDAIVRGRYPSVQ